MDESVKILCVDDEKNVLKALERLFLDEDYEIITADSGDQGLQVMEAEYPVQVIISDYRMPGMNGVDFLKIVCERWPETVRIVLSGYADTAAVVAAINEGQIYKFIPKPWNDDELKVTIAKAIESFFLVQKNIELTRELQDSNEELKALNENLENMVEERTSEVIFQNKVLARSQTILDSLPVGVLGVAPEGMIVQCNRVGCELLGNDISALLGHEASSALPAALNDLLAKLGNEKHACGAAVIGDCRIMVVASAMSCDCGQAGRILVLVPEERLKM
ncbi:MAG: response regulator [Proteobacteria bacterium]|nr:response regulator [Pseudomonadota bacterium]MBU1738490.1 response regulator [Pseudomonadota bacterium]